MATALLLHMIMIVLCSEHSNFQIILSGFKSIALCRKMWVQCHTLDKFRRMVKLGGPTTFDILRKVHEGKPGTP